MKKKPFFQRKIWLRLCFLSIFFGLMSCSEKFVVLSDKNAYHVGSGKVFSVEYDSSLKMYQQFKLTQEEYKKLFNARFGFGKEDGVRL